MPLRPTGYRPFWRKAAHEPSRHKSIGVKAPSANPRGEDGTVKYFPYAALLLLPGLLLERSLAPRLHTIRLTGDAEKGEYRFAPARLTASRGDTVVFQVVSGGPHALGIDPAGSPAVRDAWNQALPRRRGYLRGPLIRENQPYTVVIPRAVTPGKYLIFCLPHRAYDMRLEVEVK